jgi:hypothetical protein
MAPAMIAHIALANCPGPYFTGNRTRSSDMEKVHKAHSGATDDEGTSLWQTN